MPNFAGKAYYWNDNDLFVEPYEGTSTIYFCGKKLVLEEKPRNLVGAYFFFDLTNACFAKIYDDFSYDIVFEKKGFMPSKHHQGGQSSQRFERNRNNAIVAWFKRLDEALSNTAGNFVVCCQEFYFKQFVEILSSRNQRRVLLRRNSEFFNEDGVRQLINFMRT